MPASRTTTRSASDARARGAPAPPASPARATRNRPGSTARRAGRRSGGSASSSGGSSRAKWAGVGHGARIADREAAADVERVEALAARPDQARAAPGRAGRRRARRRPRPAANRRGGGSRARERPAVRAIAAAGAGELGLGHAELRGAAADGQAGVGLGRHVGVEPEEDVERRSAATAEAGPPASRASASSSSGLSTATQRSGSPSAAARTAARRSAGVLPIPSSVIRALADAGLSGRGPLAARDDVRGEPARREPRDDRRHVVRLDRVRRAATGRGRRRAARAAAASRAATDVT